MKKRILCAALAVVMLLGLMYTGTVPVNAVRLTLSEEGEAMIKAFEGYAGKPYDDNGKQLSVAWGCGVTAEQWAAMEKNPDGTITEEAAQRLFDSYIERFGNAVNNFAIQNGLTLTQGEFDALVSFCYNVGSNYLDTPTTILSKALIGGDPEEIAYAITLYGKTSEGHIKRRLLEVQMFMYDTYDLSRNWPERLRYVMLDGNGGSTRYSIYGFSLDYPVTDIRVEWASLPQGTDENGNTFTYEFAGWYDSPSGGNRITVLDGSFQNGMMVYAYWRNPITGEIDNLQPGKAEDVKVKTTAAVNLREGPSTHHATIRTTIVNELLHVIWVTTGTDGYQWGQTPDGWIRLDYTNYGTTGGGGDSYDGPEPGTYVTVATGSGLKIRNGPGLSYDRMDSAPNGAVYTLLDQREVTENGVTYLWGMIGDNRWICMKEGDNEYVSVEVVEPRPPEDTEPEVPDVSDAITVSSVAITVLPTKLVYALGGTDRTVDISGGRIVINYSDGSRKWIAMSRCMASGFDNRQRGTNTITITVGGKTTTFDVEIVPVYVSSISMEKMPTKLQYIKGQEELDLTNVTITVHYSPSGTDSIAVTADMISGFDNSVSGVQTVVVTYQEKTTSFQVEVVSNDIEKISMASMPRKLKYYIGTETLDLSGASIKVHCSFTGDEVLPITADMVSGFDNTQVGVQQITVTYQGFTTTFEVEVIMYTVTFLNYDGTVLSSTGYEYGAVVVPPADPVKPGDDHGEYDFVGWNQEVTECTGDATYTAVFKLRYPKGDVNHDLKVNSDDGIFLLWHVFYPEDYPIYEKNDLDGNGTVDADDGIYLLWHIFYPEDYPLH